MKLQKSRKVKLVMRQPEVVKVSQLDGRSLHAVGMVGWGDDTGPPKPRR
jgi:hypothetical protein